MTLKGTTFLVLRNVEFVGVYLSLVVIKVMRIAITLDKTFNTFFQCFFMNYQLHVQMQLLFYINVYVFVSNIFHIQNLLRCKSSKSRLFSHEFKD